MIVIVLIAMAAGCASALMFASIISGALISILLLYLAPLPLMMAALGWGPLCAGIGGIAAATGLGSIFGLPYSIAYAFAVALPAWWLGHLALLGRPISGSAADSGATSVTPALEWYPIGRIVVWIAGFAALTTVAALLMLGADASTITDAMRRGLLRILSARANAATTETEHWIDAVVVMAPIAAATAAMMTLTLNLWLAAKITATSGRLHRPWPDLKSTALPRMTLAALCVAIAFCFAGGLLAILSRIVAAVLMMAYAFTGFAVLHTLTRAVKRRAFWLAGTYVVVVVFTWPVLAMIILGIADAVFEIRRRFLQARPPPLSVS